MILRIKYFGLLAEVSSCEEETIDFSGSHISELLEELYLRYSGLRNKDFLVAQNQELVPFDSRISGNEIVLMPPFSGG